MNHYACPRGEECFPKILYIGFYGKPNKNTPVNCPYSYDAFYEYMASDFSHSDKTVYHDRMMEWNWDRFHDAVNAVWGERHGQMFFDDKPEDIERFLCRYFNKNLRLTGVLRGANAHTGYPYWIFRYKEITEIGEEHDANA